jgi:hypothetical protein
VKEKSSSGGVLGMMMMMEIGNRNAQEPDLSLAECQAGWMEEARAEKGVEA